MKYVSSTLCVTPEKAKWWRQKGCCYLSNVRLHHHGWIWKKMLPRPKENTRKQLESPGSMVSFLDALICLRVLHFLSTETFSKEQEWKGIISGFDGPFCYLAPHFTITSNTGQETLPASFANISMKMHAKRQFSPGSWRGWWWLLWSITLQKRHTLWLTTSENKVTERFSQEKSQACACRI